MSNLGSLSESSSLSLIRCPNFKPVNDEIKSSSLDSDLINILDKDDDCRSDWAERLRFPIHYQPDACRNNNRIGVLKRCRGKTGDKCLVGNGEDSVRVSERKSILPFLGPRKLVECRICQKLVYPGMEFSCSVHGCEASYHLICAEQSLGISSSQKFKCPQHACYLCKQKYQLFRCVRCDLAWHVKCAAFPEHVLYLHNAQGQAICWKHPTDWRQENKLALPINSIEEVFCHLPLPYVAEEFHIDRTWKDTMEAQMVPSPYIHIRRNIYLVKKKRDESDGDIGCTCCISAVCSQNCVCRVQCISCSKACRCSDMCNNRPFRKEKKIRVVKTEHCGWGLEAAESINKGEFIIEYVGEVISDALCEQRLWDMKYMGIQNFYMCEVSKDFTIDATFKGNSSRFINHGCDPNCNLEKWQLDGETRLGVFAARMIEAGETLTYDYRFIQFGPEVKCECGAQNCRGYLGAKRKALKVRPCNWGSRGKRTSTALVSIIKL